MTKLTDPVEIAEELPKWEGKELTVYVKLNPYVELGMKSLLSKTAEGSWRVQLGTKGAATGILFTSRGVTDMRLNDEGCPHLSIDVSPRTPPAGEFT